MPSREAASKMEPLSASQCFTGQCFTGQVTRSLDTHHGHRQTCVSCLFSCCQTCSKAAAAAEDRSLSLLSTHSQLPATRLVPWQSPPHPAHYSAAVMLLKPLNPQLWATEGRNESLGWLEEWTVSFLLFFSVSLTASVADQTADSHQVHVAGLNWLNVMFLLFPLAAQPRSTR